MVKKITFFQELKKKVELTPGSNSNFSHDCLDWATKIWIDNMCELIDEKLNELKK